MRDPGPPLRTYRKPILIGLTALLAIVVIAVCAWVGIRGSNNGSNNAKVQGNELFSLHLHNVTRLLEGEALETFEDECGNFYESELAASNTDCVVVSQQINEAQHDSHRALQQKATSLLVILLQVTADDDLNIDEIFEVMETSSDVLVQKLAMSNPFFIPVTAASVSLVAEIPSDVGKGSHTSGSPTPGPMVVSTATPSTPQVDGTTCTMEDDLFQYDKPGIDSACGRSAFEENGGTLCKEVCSSRFSDCCYPLGISSLDSTCSFDKDALTMLTYSKCQALSGKVDPAPDNLPDICSFERIAIDEESCKSSCRETSCCYSMGADNCLAENFDVCIDYAPCQNLRALTVDSSSILPTAPRVLDFECFLQQRTCAEVCEAAKCCSDPGAPSCFQSNFISCLTYAPCNDVTTTNIAIAPPFSHVAKPPDEIVHACNTRGPVLQPTENTCEEYCSEAECCLDPNPATNCFHRDPLGCMAWNAPCQTLAFGP